MDNTQETIIGKSVEGFKFNYSDGYVSDMDKYCGVVGVIDDINGCLCTVKFPDGDYWEYPYEQALEHLIAEEPKNYITLKWGTIKSYSFPDNPKAIELIREIDEIDENFTGESNGLRNPQSDRQKEILCELIDLSDGDTIYLHWEGRDASKQEAKDYVNNYGK